MSIDWFTFIGQIMNFLILVVLLRIFLYHRIVKAMDDREARIASRLDEADKKSKEAEQERETYHSKNQELQKIREEKISHAEIEAELKKNDLIKKAREEVNQMQEKWHETLQEEKQNFLTALRRRICEQTCAVASHALADLANSDLEMLTLEVFMKRLEDINPEEQEAIKTSLNKSGKKCIILSSFEIPEKNREKLLTLLKDQFSEKIKPEYKTSPDLIFGIELVAHDRKIAWNLETYLEDLEKKLNEAFPQKWEEESRLKKADSEKGEGSQPQKEYETKS